MRITEVDRAVTGQTEINMASHLRTLIPGQRSPQPGRDATHRSGELRRDVFAEFPPRQRDQDNEASLPLHQSRDRRSPHRGPAALQQIAFPVTWYSPISGLGRANGDVQTQP